MFAHYACAAPFVPRSSCVNAGKSVLIIDAVDTYGTAFASFSLTALGGLSQPDTPTPVSAIPSDCGDVLTRPSQQHEHSLPAVSPFKGVLPEGAHLLGLQQTALPLQDVHSFVSRDGASLGAARSYILDLVPKVCPPPTCAPGCVWHTCMHACMHTAE